MGRAASRTLPDTGCIAPPEGSRGKIIEDDGMQNHRQHQRDLHASRIAGVGEWVLGTAEFVNWRWDRDGDVNPVLVVRGGPGVGKSYIMSLVIDALSAQSEGGNTGTVVAYVYCDILAGEDPAEAVDVVGRLLLRQVLAESSSIVAPEGVRAWVEGGGGGLEVSQAVRALETAMAGFARVFLCIDGGGIKDQVSREVLELLKEIVGRAPGARLFVTSGSKDCKCWFGDEVGVVEGFPRRGDLERYASVRLDGEAGEGGNAHEISEELKQETMRVVVEGGCETFSAAALKMDTILAETTSDRRKEKLRRIADGSEGYSYAGALQRIKQQTGFRSILGMEVLMWISHSERPLRIDELCHALAVCRESCSDFDAGNAPSVHAVLSSCQGLIIIDKSDGETSIVRFIHPTLQTYLSTHTMHFSHPHCRIAETCLVYLTSRAVKALPATLTTAPPETPFLEYASYFWASHAERDLATTSSVKSLAQALLATPFDRHVSAKLLLLLDNYRSEDLDFRYFPGGFTGLHCLAFLGATGLANVLGILGQFSDINSKDFAGATPLLWAAKRGHTDFVQLLLNHPEIICDLQDETEKTALSWCALRGYTAIVQLLLSCEGVDPNVPDETGQTPLVLAAGAGNVDVVGRLLERKGVDVNAVDRVSGRTALSVAAGRGHEEVVRALLAKEGVEVERKDRRGRTALMWAGFRGWEGIVRVFLERDRGGGKEMSEEMGALAELAELGGFGEVMRVLG